MHLLLGIVIAAVVLLVTIGEIARLDANERKRNR